MNRMYCTGRMPSVFMRILNNNILLLFAGRMSEESCYTITKKKKKKCTEKTNSEQFINYIPVTHFS